MDIRRFIRRGGLSLTCEPANGNPDLHPEEIPEVCEHYVCALRGRTHEMNFHYTCGRGEGPPGIDDTMRYLGSVAIEYESCDDVAEWADEFGFDPGHIHTRSAYDAVGRLSRDLWRLVGDDMYDELCQEIEIEQAVDAALAGYVRLQGGR